MANKKITIIYYDTFASEYVLKKDNYAAPERYLELRKGVSEGIWIDQYICNNGKIIDFAYDGLINWKEDYVSWYDKLKGYLSENGVDINSVRLIAREYPPSEFEYFIKQI